MANEFKIRKGLIVEGASGGTVVDVQGSQGQLFSVTDNLSGSIFAVSDISGVPILDINSSGLSTFDGNLSISELIYHTGDIGTSIQMTPGQMVLKNSGGKYINIHSNNIMYFDASAYQFYSGNATFAAKVQASSWFQGNSATNTLYSNATSGLLLQTAGSTEDNNDSKIFFRNSATTVKHTFDTNSGDATFVGQGFSAATSSGDVSSTLTTKGYVDSLITGATIYRGTWQAGISATSSGATTASTTLTVSAAILDAAGNTPTLVGAVVTGAGITGTVKVATVTSSTVYELDTAIDATATAYIFSPIYGAPDLSGVTQTSGYYYICSEAGSATPNGAGTEPNTWGVGDWVIWNDDVGASGEWQKVDNSSVLSGVGTGQTVALWEGPSSVTDSETLGNAPITFSGNNATFAGYVAATNFRPTNIVTNKVVKFNGTQLDDSSITDTGSLVSFSTNATFAGDVALTNGQLTVTHDTNNVAKIIQADTGMSNGTYTFEVDSSSHTSNMSTAGAMAVDVYAGRAFTITGQGKVGIGTDSPDYSLSVNGSIQSDLIRGYTYPNNSFLDFDDDQTAASNHTRLASIGRIAYLADTNANEPAANAAHEFFTGTVDIDTATSLMIIQTDGNVGIGTTTPNTKLHIVDDTQFTSGQASVDVLKLQRKNTAGDIKATTEGHISMWATDSNNDTEWGRISWVNDNASDAGLETEGAMSFWTSREGTITRAMYIDHDQNVGIGTTSPDAPLEIQNTPAQASQKMMLNLDANHTGNQGSAYLQISAGSSSGVRTRIEQVTGGGSGFFGTYSDTNIINNSLASGAFGNINFITGSSTSASSIAMTIGGGSQKGNVGIGTTTPGYTLEIAGTSTTSFAYQRTGVSANKWGFHSDNDATYWQNLTSGNLLFTLQNGGNVGIGTTSPGAKLQISTTMTSSPASNIFLDVDGSNTIGGGGSIIFGTSATAGTATLYNAKITGTRSSFDDGSSDLSFFTTLVSSNTTPAVRMTIKDSGNVGIGTTTPNAKLDVQGTQGQLFSVTDDLSGEIFAVADISGVPIMTVNSSGASYFDGNVGISGNVGIGTTTPGFKLDVNGTARLTGGIITNSNQTRDKISVWSSLSAYTIGMKNGFGYGGLGGNASGTDYAMSFQMSNSNNRGWWWGDTAHTDLQGSMSLTTSGKAVIATSLTVGYGVSTRTAATTYALDVTGTIRATGDIIAYSDKRVKENIKTIDNSLEKVSKLRGVEFNKIGDDEKSIGVIAQEIEKVIPEVVKEDDKGMKSVAYGNITGVLIEAIKELKAEIEELKLNNCNCNK